MSLPQRLACLLSCKVTLWSNLVLYFAVDSEELQHGSGTYGAGARDIGFVSLDMGGPPGIKVRNV